jgi:hypothetical protein
MLNWFIRRRLAAFEADFSYDASYLHELLAMSRTAFWRFSRVQAMADYRDGVPLAAWYAAKITAARAEDCGPCTQLAVDMARRAGVSDALLRAVLRDDLAAMGEEVSLAQRYARAAIAHDAALPALRDEVRQRWGDKALASLALTITATRLYPMLKYALGHGQSCQRVRVGDDSLPVPTLQPHAA